MLFLAALLGTAPAAAPEPLDPLVVTATRAATRAFEVPAAIGVVTGEDIRAAGPQVNLSEALARVPGITALNRQNYAQDLQVSIRGFGARSTFGIRGVRLIIDGIPATLPDGQGQASTVSLASAERIEVLRGPLAQLYGNAAGGVVQVFSALGPREPAAGFDLTAGPDGERRFGARVSGGAQAHRAMVDFSRFETRGYRDHSAATREQWNARWRWELGERTRLDTVVNRFDMPEALDPGGLTRAQWEADPRQAAPAAIAQQARKGVKQGQLGAVLEHRFAPGTLLTARAYAGERNLDNALSIAPAAQLPPASAGGIVVFDRRYAGAALQVTRRVAFGAEAFAELVAGIEHDRMDEDRQGYLNTGGRRGGLRRDEDNRVASSDVFVQGRLDFTSWGLVAGARSSRVTFVTRDHYVAAGNPDDSGRLAFQAVNPVAGITWRLGPRSNAYANAGRGFETPTATELAYRTEGSGPNTALRSARSRHLEAGFKWRGEAGEALDLAAFEIGTCDEIAVEANVGGRSTFRNAGRTKRTGIEASYGARLGEAWRATVNATWLRARFEATGLAIAGTPDRSAFAELAFAPRGAWGGFNAAVEAVHTGRLFVNDANDDAAPAATVVNLRAGWAQSAGAWRLEQRLRLENATNRRYAGSVIVSESQGRYFEPARPRGWGVAVSARYEF